MNLIARFMDEFKNRGLLGALDVTPKLLIPVASHILNLRHRGFAFKEYGAGCAIKEDGSLNPIVGAPSDLRCHLMLVGEPATGKSLFRDHLFAERIGPLHGIIPVKPVLKMTDGGLVGGKVHTGGGRWVWERGLFSTQRLSMLYGEEWAAVQTAGKQGHSSNLKDTLLTALDSGEVIVDLVGVSDAYQTFATGIFGVQPARFEEDSGISRRMIFHRLPPPRGEWGYRYKLAAEILRAWEPDQEAISSLKKAFAYRAMDAARIKRIELAPALSKRLVQDKTVTPQLMPIVTKALIANWFLSAPRIEETLTVPLESSASNLIINIVDSYRQATSNNDLFEILMENTDGLTDLIKRLRDERICSSVPRAKSELQRSVVAYESHGIRYVKMQTGLGRPVSIPTGLSIEDLTRRLPGYRFVGEYNSDGDLIPLDMPEPSEGHREEEQHAGDY